MHHFCKSIGCGNRSTPGADFCEPCRDREARSLTTQLPLFERYPEKYKSVGDMTEIDVYAVHHLFQIDDPSGCLHHASRKLLKSGKPESKDIREARDILTRWLQLNEELPKDLT